MAEPRESPAIKLDSVVLIARDYGASSRNDHLHWFMSNLLESKPAASVRPTRSMLPGVALKFSFVYSACLSHLAQFIVVITEMVA